MIRLIPLIAVWPAQVLLVVLAAWLHRDQINPDAVAYIRIAQYYVNGQTAVMLSDYWGPLLSWLIVPWLLVFDDPLLAARAAMAMSAVVFQLGCFGVLRAAQLPGAATMLGTWISAVLGVAWSVAFITPDLLMAGLLCCATSRLLSDRWVTNTGTAFGAGLVLGASYLAKAVALPVSALIIIGLAGTHITASRSHLRQAVRAAILTMAGILTVAAPWIGMLSQKYGYPVFSTSGAIAHAVVGPPDMERYHPTFRTFHTPETGRITSWEDPTSLPYKYWSPFDNVAYAVHQMRVIYGNADLIIGHLKTLDWLGLGLAGAIFGYLFGTPWRQSLQKERWRWSLIPVVSLAVIYLPVFAEDARYYWAALPFLIAASFGVALRLSGHISEPHAVTRALALVLVTFSFVIGNKDAVGKIFDPSPEPDYLAAQVLADKLTMTGLVGPIASVAPGHRTGLYVAYLLNVPWFGQMQEVQNTEEILASGAALIIVPRDAVTAQQLREDTRFTSADKRLFGCGETTGAVLFAVYLTRSRSADDTCP